jgi:hypothetical protein
MAIQRVRPEFVATNIITNEDRAARVVLEANSDHNTPRRARLERIVFRNDLTPQQALDAVCDREGEVDILTEVSPADAQRIEASEHARLVTIDANRVLVGIFSTGRPTTPRSATRGCARPSTGRSTDTAWPRTAWPGTRPRSPA